MRKRWQLSLWASRKPFGIGEQRPNNYLEIWNAIRENRRNLRYAWRILKHASATGAPSERRACTTGRSTRSTSATFGCGSCG